METKERDWKAEFEQERKTKRNLANNFVNLV